MAEESDAPPPVEGALAELIELEARIAAEVAEAEHRATELVEAVRREAGATELDGGPLLEEALATLRASIEEECRTLERELAEEADAEVARHRGVDATTLDRLAAWVAARVAGGSRDG